MKGCFNEDWCRISRFTYVLKFLMKLPRGNNLMATSVGGLVSESVARMTVPNVPCPRTPVYKHHEKPTFTLHVALSGL